MPFDFQRARPLLQAGNLTRLFVEELGWEPCRQKLILRAGETDYAFTAIAEKRGFTAWLCASTDSRLPDHTTRLKLDRALAQTSFEHLIVFATPDHAQQSWVWVRREPGRPLVGPHARVQSRPARRLAAPETAKPLRLARRRRTRRAVHHHHRRARPRCVRHRARHQGVLPRLRHPPESLPQVH